MKEEEGGMKRKVQWGTKDFMRFVGGTYKELGRMRLRKWQGRK